MIDKRNETQLFNTLLRFIAACILLGILTGCSSFDGLQVPTATAQPAATKPAPLPTATTTILSIKRPVCTVTGQTVPLRPDPSKAGAPLATLRAGQVLKVIECGAWLKVSTRNKTGFIYSKYCQ